MVDLAREAFSTNNFDLAAQIYERTILENGPNSDLYLGLADSFARGRNFSKAFHAYTNAYRFGRITPEKLKHLVTGLIATVKQDITNSNSGSSENKPSFMFSCGVCRGLLSDPLTLPCGHTFCRKCMEKDKTRTCVLCSTSHYKLKLSKLKSNVVLSNLVQKLFPGECDVATLKKSGNEHISKRNFSKAVDVYTQAIRLAPTDHLLLSNRCFAYASLDMFPEALEDAEHVVKARPDWPKGYYRKGAALYGMCKYEDAAVAFLQCLALDQKVTSAKDQLSKALDKILSALPPDDPKAHALAQQHSPSLLQQLIEQNFAKPLLLPDIVSDLLGIVKDTINTANQFSGEPQPSVKNIASLQNQGTRKDNGVISASESACALAESVKEFGSSLTVRCNSVPDCSKVDHEAIERESRPRTHSPSSSPRNRKRNRYPPAASEPRSPIQSSPIKVSKSSMNDVGASPMVSGSPPAESVEVTTNQTKQSPAEVSKPDQLCIEDLECGLCYRLYYDPVTTPCGHSFCCKCLDRCLDHTVQCPICKGNLAEYLAERRKATTEAIQCIISKYFGEEFKERSKQHDEELTELARMGSAQQSEVPIFVCTLAFPTLECPLHIFEPRYRLMVRQCMESGTRSFGMCMPCSVNDFSEYGCMLEIETVEYFQDGRSVLATMGKKRFKVVSRGHRDGYNTAKVEFIKDRPIDTEELQVVMPLQREVYGMLSAWLSSLPLTVRHNIQASAGVLPPLDESPAAAGDNGPKWAWWAVRVLPVSPKIQQALLGMCSYRERLVAMKRVLTYMSRRGSQ